MRSTHLRASALALPLAAAACGVFTKSSSQGHDYTGAGVYAASAVGAAAINRGITGDCWAACPTGSSCNHESGLCEKNPCSSSCPADLKCEIVGGETMCVHKRAPPEMHDASVDAETRDGDVAD